MKKQLEAMLHKRCESYFKEDPGNNKLALLSKRNAELLSVKAKGRVHSREKAGNDCILRYALSLQYLIKQDDFFYIEEEKEQRIAEFFKGELMKDYHIETNEPEEEAFNEIIPDTKERAPFHYDRIKAVRYADLWWNEYNPDYQHFEVDCTNYISQCLRAGGAPMRGQPAREKGWWYSGDNWSYSWSVANALEIYLANSTSGLRARAVESPLELQLGDVILYDFEGDGRFNHSTIVTAKDSNGMPLVNAHTSDSRHRYWAYEDSTAYTPNIVYRFYAIEDDG